MHEQLECRATVARLLRNNRAIGKKLKLINVHEYAETVQKMPSDICQVLFKSFGWKKVDNKLTLSAIKKK